MGVRWKEAVAAAHPGRQEADAGACVCVCTCVCVCVCVCVWPYVLLLFAFGKVSFWVRSWGRVRSWSGRGLQN